MNMFAVVCFTSQKSLWGTGWIETDEINLKYDVTFMGIDLLELLLDFINNLMLISRKYLNLIPQSFSLAS